MEHLLITGYSFCQAPPKNVLGVNINIQSNAVQYMCLFSNGSYLHIKIRRCIQIQLLYFLDQHLAEKCQIQP